MARQAKVSLVGLIILIGFTVAVFVHYAAGVYLNLAYPYNTFLFRPEDRFMDFVWPYRIAANPYQCARADFQNFPFLYRVVSLFSFADQTTATILFLAIFVCFFAYVCATNVTSGIRLSSYTNLVIWTFLSYPFLVSFDRANLEIVAFICLYLFVFLYSKGFKASWVFLSCAIAMKAVPGVFLVLLLSDNRYKESVLVLVSTVGLSLLSYLSFPGGLLQNIMNHLRNLQLYTQVYAIGSEGVYFGNSLFTVVKLLAALLAPAIPYHTLFTSLLMPYGVFALVFFVLLSAYVVFIEKELWRKAVLLVCAMCLLPYVSGDYKLLHVFVPLFLFINSPTRRRSDCPYAVLFALVLVPKDYYHVPIRPEISCSVVLNPLLMVVMTLAIVADGIRQARLGKIGGLEKTREAST